jgi:hypothetical protein
LLSEGSSVRLSGAIFQGATEAEVWIFSTPRLLDKIRISDNGFFAAQIEIPDDLEPGDEMVNLRGPAGWESKFGRFYKKSTFDSLVPHFGVPDHPGLRLKKNPSQGNFLFAANVKKYRMPAATTGGKRKTKRRKNRKHRKTRK